MTVCIPPLKIQGIKTRLVPWIASIIPQGFHGVWVEPFAGSGVVGLNVAAGNALMADANPHIARFYTAVADGEITPDKVRRYLEAEGEALRTIGERHYYDIRDRFNRSGSPLDFLFLSRACFNGVMRFNGDGRYNVPFCRNANRFSPRYITKVVNLVRCTGDRLANGRFTFISQGYLDTIRAAGPGDIIYCDPPYIGRNVGYWGGWSDRDERALYRALRDTPATFILSTWSHTAKRRNGYLDSLWSGYQVITRDHFYHVGPRIENRGSVVEALVTNITPRINGEDSPEVRHV